MSKHILVVDDNDTIRHTIALILRKNGYQVSAAQNGQEALTMILESKKSNDNHFDMLLTDIQMPLMSGIELIDQLKENRIVMPVLVISGVEDARAIHESLKSDRFDFLLKPFDFRELIKRVTLLLGSTPCLQVNKGTGYRTLEKRSA